MPGLRTGRRYGGLGRSARPGAGAWRRGRPLRVERTVSRGSRAGPSSRCSSGRRYFAASSLLAPPPRVFLAKSAQAIDFVEVKRKTSAKEERKSPEVIENKEGRFWG